MSVVLGGFYLLFFRRWFVFFFVFIEGVSKKNLKELVICFLDIEIFLNEYLVFGIIVRKYFFFCRGFFWKVIYRGKSRDKFENVFILVILSEVYELGNLNKICLYWLMVVIKMVFLNG